MLGHCVPLRPYTVNGIANGAFNGLNKLTKLILHECDLEYIENGALRDMPNVESI